MPILKTTGLTKRYPDGTLAVDDINLSIDAGTIYALLGPNGAGKTTTISILTTLLQPTSGQAQVSGYNITTQPDEVRRCIGVTFQEIVLDKDLKGREVLDYHGQLYGISHSERHKRIQDLLTLVELTGNVDKMVKHYSGGMKRRLELARGLMTDPEILFLDEPTQGLDPQNRARIWAYLQELRAKRGLTILLTSHDMVEAETLADHVGIIDKGKMIVEGTPAELVDGLGADVIHLVGQGNATSIAQAITRMAFVEDVHQAGSTLQIGVDDGSKRLADIIACAIEQNYHIEEISIDRPHLGDVFLRHTGRALRD